LAIAIFSLLTLASATARQPPVGFELVTTDGKTQSGQLRELKPDGQIRLANSNTAVTVDAWLTLRRDSLPLPPHPRGPQIVFFNGDRVRLAAKPTVSLSGKQLRFEPSSPLLAKAGTLETQLSSVALIWLAAPDGADDPPLLLRQLAAGPHAKDLVLLRDGDRVEGDITAIDSAKGCQVATGSRQVQVAWSSIAAVALHSTGRNVVVPPQRHYHLVLEDGCRLLLKTAEFVPAAKTLIGKTVFDKDVQISLAKIVGLDVRGGAATYLSDLKPTKYEHTAFAGPAWPLVLDGGVSGHELRLAGSTIDKGLGTHAQCRVTYSLAGTYCWFEARVGLDPDHGQRGRVKLRVSVDGKERDLGWNKELTARDAPLALRIDVAKGRELTLEVLWAGFGDVQGHVNWADARVIR